MLAVTQSTHPFAVFGPGPYTFVSMETTDDRQAANAAAASAGLPFTTNMCGGSCDLCGTAIWTVCRFKTADGRVFKVGSECATKAGESAQVRQAKRDRKREVAAAEFRRTQAERLEAERDANERLGHGRLTNNELAEKVEADRKAAQQARRDASRHFGTVGTRAKNIELRYEGHYTFDTAFGYQTLYFLRTVDGDHAIVWKTSGCLGLRADGTEINKGESFTAAFTVKSHGEYKGEQQTTVARLVIIQPAKPKKARESKAARTQRLADEAREKTQSRIEQAERCLDMIRENLQKAEAGHPYCMQYADKYRESIAELTGEIEALRAVLATIA